MSDLEAEGGAPPVDTLFGVPIPPGASRIIIRPLWGRGGTLPLYDERLEPGDLPPTDTDVMVAASRNRDFWDYFEQQVRHKRISGTDLRWKVRVQFFNSENVPTEVFTSPEAFAFYRHSGLESAGGSVVEDRLVAFLDRFQGLVHGAQDRFQGQALQALQQIQTTAVQAHELLARSAGETLAKLSAAHSESLKASNQALSQVAAEVQRGQQVLVEMNRDLLKETQQLKTMAFALQTKLLKPPADKPAGAPLDDLKKGVELVQTLKGMGDALFGDEKKPGSGS